MGQVTELYRHYDKDGVLLYVGISLSTLKRLEQHRDNSHWFASIDHVKIERFGSRYEARVAERRAIAGEKPLHNIERPGSGQTEKRIYPDFDLQPRQAKRLSARKVETAGPGMYHDGEGLYLQVSKSGAKSWIYRYTLDGKQHWMGLGSASLNGGKDGKISLAVARQRAADQRRLRFVGKDPLEEKRRRLTARSPSRAARCRPSPPASFAPAVNRAGR